MRRILYIAPYVSPAIGGCSAHIAYFGAICSNYLNDHELLILTESPPTALDFKSSCDEEGKIFRWFPCRAGRSNKNYFSYIQYAWQNFLYIFIPYLLKREKIDIVFVHSSLIKDPNVLTFVLDVYRKLFCITMVLDIRDPKFEKTHAKAFSAYDEIIVCSLNLKQKLIGYGFDETNIAHIPIVVEPEEVNTKYIDECLAKFKLQRGSYLFNASGVLKIKGIDEGIRLTKEINNIYKKQLSYVVCGRKRDWDNTCDDAEKNNLLVFIGEVSHKEVMALALGAYLDVNLSFVDSMPRHSLEVMAANGKALLPQGVPEFEIHSLQLVASLPDWRKTAMQAVDIAEGRALNNYPSELHNIKNIAPIYIDFFNRISTRV